MILDDFEWTHLKNELKWTNGLFICFRKLIEQGIVKVILIDKNPFSISRYLRFQMRYDFQNKISLGFVSKLDVMKYLQEKQLPLPICNKIYDCFGGDINMINDLISNKEKQATENDIENYYYKMIFESFMSLSKADRKFSPNERDRLRDIYRRLQIAGYVDYFDYIRELHDNALDKFIESNLLSGTSMWHISEDIDRAQHNAIIT